MKGIRYIITIFALALALQSQAQTIAERKVMRKIGKKKLYFDSFDFGYCLTVHKAQGSEWGNVMLFEESCGYWDEDYRSKWLYTAVTRSNNRLLIIA